MRPVPIDQVPGRLFLHSMPGRFETFDEAKAAILHQRVRHVVCLTPHSEIEEKSPEYATAITEGLPWRHLAHPVADFGIPEDPAEFGRLAQTVADALRTGENVLVHCAAGIGRTGTFAVAVLCRLGYELREARRIVYEAGSSAESQGQVQFLEKICRGKKRSGEE